MSDEPTTEETAIWQRRLASQANNRAWALAESLSRSPDEDEEMLQAAHAAMYFWRFVGYARNQAHAAQLLAHVYALLKLPNPAGYYLAKAQAVFFSDATAPWELALAHAVAANVSSARADAQSHGEHYAEAVKLIAALVDPEDRKILNASLRAIPRPPLIAKQESINPPDAQ
jgi:hypothetical protein